MGQAVWYTPRLRRGRGGFDSGRGRARVGICPLIILGLNRAGRLSAELKQDLWHRYYTWLAMIPAIVAPIILGAFWTILAVCVLSLFCFREFARATGFFREKLMNVLVVLAIIALGLASLDRWYRLFVALTPIIIVVIAAVSTSLDRPKGYIQRVGMASLSFLLFGTCLGHIGCMANDEHYRSLLLLLFFSVQMNDLFGKIVGRVFGGPTLAPQTNPNKTISGSLGAIRTDHASRLRHLTADIPQRTDERQSASAGAGAADQHCRAAWRPDGLGHQTATLA